MKKDKENHPSEARGQILEDMTPLEILESAIYDEQSACDFYSYLFNQIRNQSGKEKFKFLAEDEKRHRSILEKEYQKESKGRRFKFNPKKAKTIKVKVDSESSASSALDLAIQAERGAYKFYTRAAEKVKSQSSKNMFLRLAEEEDRHYNLLAAERQALSSNFYWYEYDVPGVMEE
ncbi:MAG: ferritin family protein [candidate division Zixibacteria bacterium]|nr:ferritin family protein [candidate division Zixibacteria bacterium]